MAEKIDIGLIRKELKLSFWQRLTGSKNPPKARKTAAVIVLVILYLVGFFSGYCLNQALIRPYANAVFQAYVEDNSLPIAITNGPKPLENVELAIKTCYMNNFKRFQIPDLIPGQTYNARLYDNETVFALNDIFRDPDFTCNNDINTSVQCYIQTYIVNGKLYVPPQECKVYTCGYCNYEMEFISNKYSQNFTGKFPGPVEIKFYNLNVLPKDSTNIDYSNATKYNLVGLSIFTPYHTCLISGHSEAECQTQPKEVTLNTPLELTLPPKNQLLGNFTIYLYYS
jgi:hypothetical protein